MKHSVWPLLGLVVILILIGGCNTTGSPSTLKTDPTSLEENNASWADREILGRYHITVNSPESSPVVIPIRDTELDKQILDYDAFGLTCSMVGFDQNPDCQDDPMAGDIEFQVKLDNAPAIQTNEDNLIAGFSLSLKESVI